MIGAGSWLLLVCFEKLQEISGAAAFFVETQTAVEQNIMRRRYLEVFEFYINTVNGCQHDPSLEKRQEYRYKTCSTHGQEHRV